MKRIMFNDRYGLTQAVLEGKKTMTRREMKLTLHKMTKLAYHVGEEVWIAQSYKDLGYKPNEWIENSEGGYQQAHEFVGYTNKMFVRSVYLEHRIRITDIKLEGLQDITDEDCLKEGVEKWIDGYIVPGIMENQGKNNVCFDTAREAFAALIDRISGKGTWQSNPWVYVYSFELLW